jgi:hypothetical protein
MANEGLINLVAWCKRERESLQMQREMLQSGKFRIVKDEGSGQVDTSSESIERITANMAELDGALSSLPQGVQHNLFESQLAMFPHEKHPRTSGPSGEARQMTEPDSLGG